MKTRLAVALVILLATCRADPAAASVEDTHWPHAPGRWPVVTVADHTLPGDHWNVRLAVREWGSGLRYGWCTDPHAACVRVVAHRPPHAAQRADGGRNGILGSDYRWTDGDGATMRFGVAVMNRAYVHVRSARVKTQAVVHELGHELGLGHDHTGGVMSPYAHAYPIAPYERAELRAIYGIET